MALTHVQANRERYTSLLEGFKVFPLSFTPLVLKSRRPGCTGGEKVVVGEDSRAAGKLEAGGEGSDG